MLAYLRILRSCIAVFFYQSLVLSSTWWGNCALGIALSHASYSVMAVTTASDSQEKPRSDDEAEGDRTKEIQLGSETAKAGFTNEDAIRDKFLAWQTDRDAKAWLAAMNYNWQEIVSIEAWKPHGQKADVMLMISLKNQEKCREGISIKLVSNPNGFNQIDKRWLKNYAKRWDIPEDVHQALQRFVGEIPPDQGSRDTRRTFLDEMPAATQQSVVKFFESNRHEIARYLVVGEGDASAQWFMVTLQPEKLQPEKTDSEKSPLPETPRWILVRAEEAARFFSEGDVVITPSGNLRIGRITMQRKGGDNGRESAKMLQFKVNPADLLQAEHVN